MRSMAIERVINAKDRHLSREQQIGGYEDQILLCLSRCAIHCLHPQVCVSVGQKGMRIEWSECEKSE